MDLAQIGKYEIVGKIGQGAMGEVYKARDPALGRFVAIKTISQRLDVNDLMRQRFQREAQAAAQLAHPNIITVFEFGEEAGMSFIAMELLEGIDLKEVIERRKLPRLEDKLPVLEQICEGLAFAHSKGLVHRDLKPGNIHILPNGQVKIMDFGLARRTSDAAKTAVVMGTPYYMAPEQAQGGRASARSDIFSLGAVAYELLAGRRPFGGESVPAVLYSVVHTAPEPLAKWIPELPHLATLVEKALAKDPHERFENAGEMREALRDVVRAFSSGYRYDPAAATMAGVAPPRPAASRPAPKTLSQAEDTAEPIKEALFELQQYLSDHLPPLMVADSMLLLLDCPPEGVATEIYAWALAQTHGPTRVSLTEYLFHALSKIHLMGEFRLLEKERLDAYLSELAERIIDCCSEEDEEHLRSSLKSLGRSEMVSTAEILHRQIGGERVLVPEGSAAPSGGKAPSSAGPASAAELRRLTLLVERLRQEVQDSPPGGTVEATRSQLISQTLASAVAHATSERELEEHLGRLRELGVAAEGGDLFRSLGQGLSDWVLPGGASGSLGLDETGQVEAMRRVIVLAEEPVEMARRFRGMVYAAIDEFNQGNLGRAVKMLELAERLIKEKQFDGSFVETIRRKGHESIDISRLRKLAESPEKHAPLRTVLNFFHFGLGHRALLDELQGETRRDRRRLLLDLLQAHGPPVRVAALQRLEAHRSGGDDPGPYMLRNIVYLLRLIPRVDDEGIDREIDLLSFLAEPGWPPFLAREVISALASMKPAKAKQSLVGLLHSREAALGKADVPDRTEGHALLDRLCSALIRTAHPAAWSAVVEHALGERPELGSTIDRLAEFSSQDLRASPPVLARLLEELRARLPHRVLSFLVTRNDQALTCLIEALSGTPADEVKEALTDIVRRFSGHSFAVTAQRALEGLLARAAAPPAVPPTQNESGDLEVFGLPSLLHRVVEKQATGLLTLLDSQGTPMAALTLEGGRVRTCQIGPLQGEEAFFQLLERPFAGAFSLLGRPPNPGASSGAGFLDVGALTSQGILRYGSLQKASALVPDDVALEATGQSPTAVPSEPDYTLVVKLWEKACAGVTPRQCEAEIPVDSFRIRRALGHWVEEGALKPRAAQ
ncbi:MAG TPA: protein kinase [Vicinamibacteria bacterium]|nr:protein kinase [Vicinamibacteria bacterium]